MEPSYPPPPQKKGIGPLGWIGMGCGGIILLVVIAAVVATMMYGGKVTKFANDFTANPTKVTATTTAKLSGGEIVAADDANKRYTVRDKSGTLTTIYWDEKKQGPAVVPGDFSAIPKSPDAPTQSASPPEQK